MVIEQIYADEGYDLSPEELLDAVAKYLDTDLESVVAYVASYLKFYSTSDDTKDEIQQLLDRFAENPIAGVLAGSEAGLTQREVGPAAVGMLGQMGKTAVGTAFLVGTTFFYGPEDAIISWLGSKGIRVIWEGGKRVLQRVVKGRWTPIVEHEVEGLAKEYAACKAARNGKLNAPHATDPVLQDAYRNLWRPQDVNPGGTIGELLREAETGAPLKHLQKAKERLQQLIHRVTDTTNPLSPSDRAGAERVINDLKDAIRRAEGK